MEWGKKINIYILTSDKSIDTIEGFQYCFNKYWSPIQQVIILGYTSPTFKLNDNFKFISLGEDRGADYIGGDLISFFQNVDDNHFIFSLDDFLLIRYVDIDLLEFIKDKFIKENIHRFSLTDQVSNKSHDIIYEQKDFNIIEMGQYADYRKSAVWSMWSKDYFLKYFKDNMNLWQWELDTSCKNDGYRVIGTTGKYVVQSCHLYKQGNLKPDWYKDSESIDVMFDDDKLIIKDMLNL
jgi:hypothetical protein